MQFFSFGKAFTEIEYFYGQLITLFSLCFFPSIFVSLAFVPICCFAKFCSVVLHGSLISNIVSLECYLCNLNLPCWNMLMEFDFNFLTLHIISSSVTKSTAYISSLTFQQPLETLAHNCQNKHPKFPLISKVIA